MEYELKGLEQIVSVILQTNRIKPVNPDAAFIGKYKRLVHLEKERIKMQFIKAAFEPGAKSRLALYYRQHQCSLVQLANDIYYFQRSKNNYRVIKDVPVTKFYKEIYQCVEYLLNFIESHYSTYFDQDAKIPEALRWGMAAELKINISSLQSAFKKNGIPAELINIACRPMADFLLPDTIVTYCELKFIKELQWELLNLAKRKDLNNCTEHLCSLLLHLNYNSILFFNYYIEQIGQNGKSYVNSNELIEYYYIQLKFINQVIVKPGSVYKTNLLSLNDQIGKWLAEELYFLEKQQRFFQLPVNNADSTTHKPKVHTSLSVAHLSLVIKLLLDANVIKSKNSTELLKQVAGCFRTDNSEKISEDSLRNKFYNFDEHTVDQVKDVIKGLMGVVMRY